ncbi:MAG: DUF6147 family protein [Ruminococcus sp.]
MKRCWRRLGGLLAAAIVLCGLSTEVHAETEVTELEVPVYHYFTDTETEVSDSFLVLQRGAYLSSGGLKLVVKGDGTIGIYGDTTAYSKCDKLYLDIYLERSSNGQSFYSYAGPWEYTASNAYSLSKSFTKSVPHGYYYRLRGYHAAKEGGVKESTSTMTNGKYV